MTSKLKLKILALLLKWFHETYTQRNTANEERWTAIDTARGMVYKVRRDGKL